MLLLDRHLLRAFAQPFIYLLLGLIAVWLVADLANYLPDFLEAKVAPAAIALVYWKQLPFVLLTILPVCTLLALLAGLVRLSQANELLAMTGAGLGFGRLLRPFLLAGLGLSLAAGALNFKLAPQAEGAKGRLVAELTNSRDNDGRLRVERYDYAVGHLYANRRDRRLWYVQRLAKRVDEPLLGVQISQQDEEGNLVAKWSAPSARYDLSAQAWRLQRPRVVTFDRAGGILSERFPPEEILAGWPETPARIAASTLQPQFLSVRELRYYLRENADAPAAQLAPFQTHLHYRFALPAASLLLVLLAAPLTMTFARQRVVAGVVAAILGFFAWFFLDKLFLSLGVGARVPPFWAAWTPNLLLLAAGLLLARQRAVHVDRPLTSGEGLREFFGVGTEAPAAA